MIDDKLIDGHSLDGDVDVYVTGGLMNGVIVEVVHGERISHARQFGVDWDGPIHTAMHGAVYGLLSQRSLIPVIYGSDHPALLPRAATWRDVIVGVITHNRIACACVLCVCVWYAWAAWIR